MASAADRVPIPLVPACDNGADDGSFESVPTPTPASAVVSAAATMAAETAFPRRSVANGTPQTAADNSDSLGSSAMTSSSDLDESTNAFAANNNGAGLNSISATMAAFPLSDTALENVAQKCVPCCSTSGAEVRDTTTAQPLPCSAAAVNGTITTTLSHVRGAIGANARPFVIKGKRLVAMLAAMAKVQLEEDGHFAPLMVMGITAAVLFAK